MHLKYKFEDVIIFKIQIVLEKTFAQIKTISTLLTCLKYGHECDKVMQQNCIFYSRPLVSSILYSLTIT